MHWLLSLPHQFLTATCGYFHYHGFWPEIKKPARLRQEHANVGLRGNLLFICSIYVDTSPYYLFLPYFYKWFCPCKPPNGSQWNQSLRVEGWQVDWSFEPCVQRVPGDSWVFTHKVHIHTCTCLFPSSLLSSSISIPVPTPTLISFYSGG